MPLSTNQLQNVRVRAERVAQDVALLHREAVDQDSRWPSETMHALGKVGLLGLQVPRSLGGHGEGLTALVTACEALAQVCPSSALCFGMHCVGTAVIAAKATAYQQEYYLRPIALGKHITTLAVSEKGTGSHLYLAETRLLSQGEEYVIEGSKHFVTSGGHADSYVVTTVAAGADAQPGQFSCILVDDGLPGMTWDEPWQGLGMRGNEARALRLDRVRVPRSALLGEEGDQVWYIFEVVAPYFLMAMSGTYLGIAAAALQVATEHLQSRQFSHSGERLAGVPVLQHRLAEMWIQVQRTRALVYRAAAMGDAGDPNALVPVGTYVEPDEPLVLVVEAPEDAEKAWLELARIGYERAVAYLVADTAAWGAAELEVREMPQLEPCCVDHWVKEGRTLLDARTPGEWNAGAVEGAVWIPLAKLPERLAEIPAGPVAVMCGSGYRSSIGSSVLERAGRTDVVNVRGGWSAYSQRQCAEPDSQDLFCQELFDRMPVAA